MNKIEIKHELEAALRQYRHNDDSPDFVFAYETTRVDRLIERLTHEQTKPSEMNRLLQLAEDCLRHGEPEQRRDLAERIHAYYVAKQDLYACIKSGCPAQESECVIIPRDSIRSWVQQALFSGRWDEAPMDVKALRESAANPDEWEDSEWSVQFEDGWLRIHPVTRIEGPTP